MVSQGGTVWRATHGEQRRDRVERRKKKKERGSVWWAKEAPCGGPKLAMAIVCRPLGVPCLSRLVAKKERKPEVGRPSDTVVVLTIAGVASSTLRAALRKNLLFFRVWVPTETYRNSRKSSEPAAYFVSTRENPQYFGKQPPHCDPLRVHPWTRKYVCFLDTDNYWFCRGNHLTPPPSREGGEGRMKEGGEGWGREDEGGKEDEEGRMKEGGEGR